MYHIWNFCLSLAHQQQWILCWFDNSGGLVAQSWTASLLKIRSLIGEMVWNIYEMIHIWIAVVDESEMFSIFGVLSKDINTAFYGK